MFYYIMGFVYATNKKSIPPKNMLWAFWMWPLKDWPLDRGSGGTYQRPKEPLQSPRMCFYVKITGFPPPLGISTNLQSPVS